LDEHRAEVWRLDGDEQRAKGKELSAVAALIFLFYGWEDEGEGTGDGGEGSHSHVHKPGQRDLAVV
jgi:hypothetical protein